MVGIPGIPAMVLSHSALAEPVSSCTSPIFLHLLIQSQKHMSKQPALTVGVLLWGHPFFYVALAKKQLKVEASLSPRSWLIGASSPPVYPALVIP